MTPATKFSSVSECSGVQWSKASWLVRRELLQFGHCKLLLLESGSEDPGIVEEPRIGGMTAAGSHYQATTGEDSRLKKTPCML
jgi:hypothetical protein